MKRELLHADIAVVGAGIAGLQAARDLSLDGYNVVVVEKAKRIATGAVTKNQGWAHSGVLQADQGHFNPEKRRKRIAEVKEGFAAFRPYFADCVEDPDARTFVVFSDQARAARAEADWRESGIDVAPVRLDTFFREHAEINPEMVAAAYRVPDVSINTRKLSEALAQEIINNGGRILTGTDLTPIDEQTAVLTKGDRSADLTSGLFVVAAGAGTKPFFERYTGEPFPMRYLQDFTLVTPSLSKDAVIWRQERGVNIMPHGETSVTCLGLNMQESDEPRYNGTLHSRIDAINAVAELVPEAASYLDRSRIVSCLKPFVTTDPEITSGDIKIEEWVPGYVYVLPGKMTAAPVASRQIVDFVAQRGVPKTLDVTRARQRRAPQADLRPCDIFVARH